MPGWKGRIPQGVRPFRFPPRAPRSQAPADRLRSGRRKLAVRPNAAWLFGRASPVSRGTGQALAMRQEPLRQNVCPTERRGYAGRGIPWRFGGGAPSHPECLGDSAVGVSRSRSGPERSAKVRSCSFAGGRRWIKRNGHGDDWKDVPLGGPWCGYRQSCARRFWPTRMRRGPRRRAGCEHQLDPPSRPELLWN